MHWYMEDKIVVLKKGPRPHLWRNKCNMFITQEEMAAGHIGTTM